MSLSKKLVMIVLVTFLPVNFLAVAVCSFILIQASGQVKASYQRELDQFMGEMFAVFGQIEDSFSDFLVDYMSELTIVAVRDAMADYEMITDLKSVFEDGGCRGMYFLYENGTENIYLKYSANSYAVTDIEKMKQELRQQCREETAGECFYGEWGFLNLKEGGFLYKRFDYLNYRVGFLLDMKYLLEDKGQSSLWTDNLIYLKNGENVYIYKNGRIKPYTERKWNQIFKNSLLGRNVDYYATEQDSGMGIEMINRSYKGGVPRAYWVLLGVSIASVLLAWTMWITLKKQVLDTLKILRDGMEEVQRENLTYRIERKDYQDTEEFHYLYESFNKMAQEIGLSREKDRKMHQVEMDNLRLQVNPHMLLNSFNMIYSLAQSKKFQCIQEYSLLLVEYFRYSLKDTGQPVPLKKEMEFVENYTNIQKLRYPGSFTSVYNVAQECEKAMVPPLLVENFVENAMKYAIQGGSTIEVLINIRKDENKLLISICDTGRGIKPEVLSCLKEGKIYVDKLGKQHIGVWNCRRRMELFYGKQARMNILSSPGEGTQVWLELPFETGEEENG